MLNSRRFSLRFREGESFAEYIAHVVDDDECFIIDLLNGLFQEEELLLVDDHIQDVLRFLGVVAAGVDDRRTAVHLGAHLLGDGVGEGRDDGDGLPRIETVDQVVQDFRTDIDRDPCVHCVLDPDDESRTDDDEDIEHEHARAHGPAELLVEHAGDDRGPARCPAGAEDKAETDPNEHTGEDGAEHDIKGASHSFREVQEHRCEENRQ